MPDVAEAAPSTATAEPSFEIPRSGTDDYAHWRTTGELPEKKETPKAEPATADTSKATTSEPEKAETAPASEPGKKTQEVRKPNGAESRIKELLSRTKQLERDLEEARRPKPTLAAAPSTAKPEIPQTYQEWRKAFKPAEWVQKYASDNPQASYEDANAAMADHLADVRDQFRTREQQRAQLHQELDRRVSDARQRYQDFDSVGLPVVAELVKSGGSAAAVINDSPVVADILYTIGGAPDRGAQFLNLCRTNPTQALRMAVEMERLIQAELGKGKPAGRSENGQFKTEEAPAKRGPESAPEPPLEVGSRGTGPMDESERALKAIERGDFRATRDFLRAENAKDLRRRRGA